MVWVIFLEIQDILDAGATERIYTLGIVAHHANVVVVSCQLFDDHVLRVVRILVLVNQNVFENALVLGQDFRMVPEQCIGF